MIGALFAQADRGEAAQLGKGEGREIGNGFSVSVLNPSKENREFAGNRSLPLLH